MHILLPTDVFPPGAVGGAAWSAYTLARCLQQRGHLVTVVVPVQQATGGESRLAGPDHSLGVPVYRYAYRAPSLPIIQNYYRHERLWPGLAAALTTLGRPMGQPRIIHAQHVQTIPPSVIAARRLGVPVVATVRDHWPWHYFATSLHGDRVPYPAPATRATAVAALATDVVARLGAVRGCLALAGLPYMVPHVRRRAALLGQSDAVIAVSQYIADRLHGIVPPERLHVVHNIVDGDETAALAATPPRIALPQDFLLFVGKLEPNKGAALLPAIFRSLSTQARERLATLPPLVVVGRGSLQPSLERELAGLGVATRFLSWVDHDEVVRLMARCQVLLFPSCWGEPLSRVLLEAGSVGAPMLAMSTGGTPDILHDGVSGALAVTPEQVAHRLLALLDSPSERVRLGEGARAAVRSRFSREAILPQVEGVYAACLERG
jgi:glycogen synthase